MKKQVTDAEVPHRTIHRGISLHSKQNSEGTTKEVKPPCKDCKQRKVTDDYNCHMECEKYLAFQAYRAEIAEARAKKYAVEPKRRRYF